MDKGQWDPKAPLKTQLALARRSRGKYLRDPHDVDSPRVLRGRAARAGATAAVAGAWSPLLSPRAVSAAQRVFRHGVASGDPLANRVILWTRVSTEGGEPLTTHWRIALDPEMRRVVGGGSLQARPENDFTLKVDADGL